jgi:tetratricopeptide (TPR) repeat protein
MSHLFNSLQMDVNIRVKQHRANGYQQESRASLGMTALLLLASVLTLEGEIGMWRDELLQANRLRDENRHAEAESAYTVARGQAEKLGTGNLPLAITLNDMGYYYQSLGRLLEAERAYSGSLRIMDRQLGSASHRAIEVRINLSSVYLEMNQLGRAESLVRNLLEGGGVLSPEDRGALLADLGSVLCEQGRLEEAESTYQQALALFERDPRTESRERTATTLSNLSTVASRRKRFAEALEYLERGRAVLAELKDPPAMLTIKTLTNAAVLSALAGKPEQSEPLFRLALSECERIFGPDHFLLGHLLTNYSEYLRRSKRKSDAASAGKRGRAILAKFSKENMLGHTVDVKVLRQSSLR